MRTHANDMVISTGALLVWFAVGCSASDGAAVTGAANAANTPQGGTPNSGGLSSQSGGAITGSNGTGGASNIGNPMGGVNAGGANTGGTGVGGATTAGANTGGTITGSTPTGGANSGGTPVGGASSGGKATGGTQNAGGSAIGGNANNGGSAAGGTPSAGGATNSGGSASGGYASGGSATAGTSAGATGTVGCNGNAVPPTSASNGYLSIDVNGTARQYVLELPTGYDGKTPVPVLFSLHGTGTTAQEFLGSGYGNVRKGIAGRTLIVGPQGLSRNGQTGWAGNGGIEQVDIDFFDALVVQLKANYCVDPSRFFAMGHSAGAMYSNELGCRRSNVIRAIGPFAGAGPFGTCGGKVAAFIGHNPKEGDAAECAKMSGGTCPWVVKWNDSGWPTTQFWTKKDGCGDPGAMPTAAFEGNSTTGSPLPCKAYAGCDANYPVTLCLYDYWDQWDGPHAFPLQWAGKTVTDFFLALPKVQ